MEPLELLSGVFMRDHPEEAVRVLERHPHQVVARLLGSLPPSEIILILENALPAVGAAYLELLEPSLAFEALMPLSDDKVLGLLRPLKDAERGRLLDLFPASRRKAFAKLLAYTEGTAGSVMDPIAYVLSDDLTVGEALQRVRQAGRESFYYPYVVDRRQRLVGLLTVRALMLADPEQPLREIMRPDVAQLPAEAAIARLEKMPGWRAYQSLPVVDTEGVLIGVIPNEKLAQLQTEVSGPSLPNALSDILVTLGIAYWDVMAHLTLQATDLLAERRPGPDS